MINTGISGFGGVTSLSGMRSTLSDLESRGRWHTDEQRGTCDELSKGSRWWETLVGRIRRLQLWKDRRRADERSVYPQRSRARATAAALTYPTRKSTELPGDALLLHLPR